VNLREKKKRIVVIGAGPIGLEAARAAMGRGHEVRLFEAGRAAESVRRWGYVRMFSPFALNGSRETFAHVERHGFHLPPPESILTASEYADAFLEPLAETLNGIVRTNAPVLAISRAGLNKGDYIFDPRRALAPFSLLVREGERESVVQADAVLDCSGNFQSPRPLGTGGIPAPGEQAAQAAIQYGVSDPPQVGGLRVLVVGAGHSAATMVCNLAAQRPAKLFWAIRKPVDDHPYARIPDDPLPERDRLLTRANALARSPEVRLLAPASVQALSKTGEGLAVTLSVGGEPATVVVDRIFAATGFRPDLGLTRELQVQTCWATEGAYKLAALLLDDAGGDCLKAPVTGAETLSHPEPGFFTLGMKSYGRRSDFLIRTGLEQVRTVLDALERAA
jgi:threonine dehydrogenase-like Zn-dependent dehydrogenase